MKNYTRNFLAIPFILIALTACSTVPLTGRPQLDLVPSFTMLSMSFQQTAGIFKHPSLGSNADRQN